MSSEQARITEGEAGAFETESSLTSTLAKFRHSPTSIAGLCIIGLLVAMALFSALDNFLFGRTIISTLHADPHAMNQANSYAEPSREHPFGTDRYGRDILSRIVYGSRTALSIGIVAVGIGFSGGVVIGTVAAYFGGWVDDVLMRAVEILYAVPGLILALVFMAILGPSIYNLFLAYGIVGIPAYARVMRSEALSIRQQEYVAAAKLAGLPRWKILFREIVPNGIAPVVVQATLSMGGIIIGAAALSFLGFGVQPPTPDWGRMLSDGRTALLIAWWVAFFPGAMIFLTVMGFNMLGDGLRDVMDPKTQVESVDWDDLDRETEALVAADDGGRPSATDGGSVEDGTGGERR
jgi:peptide/nickel transport system permease protein